MPTRSIKLDRSIEPACNVAVPFSPQDCPGFSVMYVFIAALLATGAWSDAAALEPSEDAMRDAFASGLSEGVKSALAFVAETEGPEGLARIRMARTDEFEIRAFRKDASRPSAGEAGHVCNFTVEIDTVAGPIMRSLVGRFFVGLRGLAFDQTTDDR